jgi:hypothetical protein
MLAATLPEPAGYSYDVADNDEFGAARENSVAAKEGLRLNLVACILAELPSFIYISLFSTYAAGPTDIVVYSFC